MSYPKTTEEWWQLLEENKENMISLIKIYHPYWRNEHNHKISANKIERLCETIRENIAEETKENPTHAFEDAYLKKDGMKIAGILGEVWFGMPESFESREESGFGALCDLCSESYLVGEDL